MALATGSVPIDRFTVEGAKAMLWYAHTSRQQTLKAAAESRVMDATLGAIDDPIVFLGMAQAVTGEEVQEAMVEFVLPALMPKTSSMVVTYSMKDSAVSTT
jgi:hypothetical protein